MSNKIMITLFALFIVTGCSTGHNAKPTTPTSQPEAASEISLMTEFEQNVGDRVFFAYDSSDLTEDSKNQLAKQAAWLVNHPNVKATIEGHADERGTREYNLALGERRAEAIRQFLKHHGVDASRLDTISYGKERPAAIGNNEEAWRQNRRGVIFVY